MDDEHPVNGDPMLSHHPLHSPHSSSTSSSHHHVNSMNHNNSDPLLSLSNHNHCQHPHSVDISSCCIGDPLLSPTHNLLASPHRSDVDSILSSPDSDALVSDIDIDIDMVV